MRAGHQTGADIDWFGKSHPGCHGDGAFHAHPQLVASLTQYETNPFVGERHVVEIGLDGVAGRDLRHRSVITAMPTFELILVARTAGLRACVTGEFANMRQAGDEG